MDTSIEIAKILQAQKAKKVIIKSGFDNALLGLGIHLKNKISVELSKIKE